MNYGMDIGLILLWKSLTLIKELSMMALKGHSPVLQDVLCETDSERLRPHELKDEDHRRLPHLQNLIKFIGIKIIWVYIL